LFAVTRRRYLPSGRTCAPQPNEPAPAGRCSSSTVTIGAPVASSTCAVTCPGAPSEKVTSIVSLVPSGLGVTTVGDAASFVSERAGRGGGAGTGGGWGCGGGGGSAAAIPSDPVAGRIPGALIVHAYRPLRAAAELHVQSTFDPLPLPLATVTPRWSTTLTVHARLELRRAWNRTGPPRTPITVGE